ncbi:hypothetical protein DMA11_14860 [Marinilabiliaceae bacterium JC017]|nr:hypothetical protein DMA11_14860 [Marinilabiliaceae bacterium JC017]
MKPTEALEFGKYYHIYNRGINSTHLFDNEADYKHFLKLFERYIDPIAEIYAWVLMPNHFHALIRMRDNICYKYTNTDESIKPTRFEEIKWETIKLPSNNNRHRKLKIPQPYRHFSHLFNAYTKYYNNRNNRHGGLFERSVKHKLIKHEAYLKNLVLYIHHNPVHHGFCSHPIEYGWSSYLTFLSSKTTKLKRNDVLEWFNNNTNFKCSHDNPMTSKDIDSWLDIN